jgi:hypothetical protein
MAKPSTQTWARPWNPTKTMTFESDGKNVTSPITEVDYRALLVLAGYESLKVTSDGPKALTTKDVP